MDEKAELSQQPKRRPTLGQLPAVKAIQERRTAAKVAKGIIDAKTTFTFDKDKFDAARSDIIKKPESESAALGEMTTDHNHPSSYFQNMGEGHLWEIQEVQDAFLPIYQAFRRGEPIDNWVERHYNIRNRPNDPRPRIDGNNRRYIEGYLQHLGQPKTQVLIITPEEMREYEEANPGAGINHLKDLSGVEKVSIEGLVNEVKQDFATEGKVSFKTKRRIAAQKLDEHGVDFLADVINLHQAAKIVDSEAVTPTES